MSDLSEKERIGLQWMRRCNLDGDPCGYLGPSVRRMGPVPEYARLVRDGLAGVLNEGPIKARGYWITEKGEAALNVAE